MIFPRGYHQIHPDVSMNFQMNRWYGWVGENESSGTVFSPRILPMNAVLKPQSDIAAMMQGMGRHARAAARAMARAGTATKDKALREIAAAVRHDRAHLQAENARDINAGRWGWRG